MPTGNKGMINQLSNMVAPQVCGDTDGEILPQDVCEDNGMTNRSFEYSDDELALARTLHTLKSTNVRTENVAKETSDDESTNILGIKYLRKRSMSNSNIALQNDSNVRNMVSKISYGKHRTSKSFDGNCRTSGMVC